MAKICGTMSLVLSTFTLELGQRAPQFSLSDSNGISHGLDGIKGTKGTLIAFVCNHCPFVVHLAKQMADVAQQYQPLGINTVAINSNDVANYPQDSPEKMLEFAVKYGWNFPYLYDETQLVAHAYSAACTPDFFLLDGDGSIYYAGQFDDSRPNNKLVIDGIDLKNAMDRILAGKSPKETLIPATGCNIKWKAGNEPSYFS